MSKNSRTQMLRSDLTHMFNQNEQYQYTKRTIKKGIVKILETKVQCIEYQLTKKENMNINAAHTDIPFS